VDGCKGLPHRHPYVWKENLLERDVEVAEIQRIKDKRQKYKEKSKKIKVFLCPRSLLLMMKGRSGTL
jgi:hypothetical protein